VTADLREAEVGGEKMFERLTGVIARLAGRRDKCKHLNVKIPSTVATGTVDGISVHNESGRLDTVRTFSGRRERLPSQVASSSCSGTGQRVMVTPKLSGGVQRGPLHTVLS
jgi:hypothetical protein